MSAKITIIGLGPGGKEYLTLKAFEVITSGNKIYLRTEKHPTVDYIKTLGIEIETFDEIYEREDNFEKVYDEIVKKLIEYSKERDIVYAVPGSPFVAESTVEKLIELREEFSLNLEFIDGVSFIEAIINRLEVDPIHGLKVIDGLQMDRQKPDPKVNNIITQVFNNLVASEVKLKLMEYYDDEYEIILVKAAGVEGEEKVLNIPLYQLDRLEIFDHLTSIFIPKVCNNNNRKFKFHDLVEIMAKLRSKEGGCPWDREQTHESLKPYLIEETYEVLEALDNEDPDLLQEELGDLLLQIVFHSQIAKENGYFTIGEVISGICNKLISRHPHVFGDLQVKSSEKVLENWEEIKRKEKREESYTESLRRIPKGLPSLMKSYKVQSKAAKVGFDWENVEGAIDKVKEELGELLKIYKTGEKEKIREEIGDLLFAIVNVARFFDIMPELALNETIEKFIRRFEYIENKAREKNQDLNNMTLEDMDRLWNEAKNLGK